MGIQLNAQIEQNSQYVKDIGLLVKFLVRRVFSPLKRFQPIYMLTSQYWEERKVAARVYDFTRKVINDRKTLRRANAGYADRSNGFCKNYEKTSSLLDIILDAEHNGAPLTEDDIVFETQNFLFAVIFKISPINKGMYSFKLNLVNFRVTKRQLIPSQWASILYLNIQMYK